MLFSHYKSAININKPWDSNKNRCGLCFALLTWFQCKCSRNLRLGLEFRCLQHTGWGLNQICLQKLSSDITRKRFTENLGICWHEWFTCRFSDFHCQFPARGYCFKHWPVVELADSGGLRYVCQVLWRVLTGFSQPASFSLGFEQWHFNLANLQAEASSILPSGPIHVACEQKPLPRVLSRNVAMPCRRQHLHRQRHSNTHSTPATFHWNLENSGLKVQTVLEIS